jgi:hypothetical protein
MSDQEDVVMRIPLRWEGIDIIDTIYANELVITHAGGREFYLIFGEVQIPVIINPEVERPPDVIKVKPVVKLAIPRDEMIKFAATINDNVSRYLDRVSRSDND